MDSAVGTGVVEPVSAHGQNAHTRARAPSTPTTRKVRPGVDPSASVRPESEVGVEEELIVIESDTDDEVDVDMGSLPKLRSALDVSVLDSAASSPSKGLFLSHGPPRNSNTGGRPGSSAKDLVTKSSALGVQSAPSAPVSSSGMIRHNRISFSAVVASLQASNGSKLEVSASASRSSPASSPSTSAVKPISKRMRSRTGIKTQDTVISFRAGTSASSSLLVSLDGSKTHASTPMATAVNSPSVPSTIQSNPLGGVSSGLSAKASTRPNPVVLQKAAAKTPLRRTNEPQRTLVVTTMEPKSALTQGLESPTKSRKKPLVMEVVLTPLRHASKPILQLAGSPTSTTPTEPLPANFLVSHSGRSPVSTPSPKAKSAIQASNTSKGESDQPSNSAAIISTGVRANHAQKRGRESGEGFKAEDTNELTEAALKLIHGLGTMHPSGSSGYAHEMWLPPGAHTPYTLPRAGVMQAQAQVGPSVQVLPPKLEPPSSREEIIPDSQEKVPSSQEYERRKGKGNQKGRVEPQLAQPTGDESRVLPPFNTRPPSPQPLPRARATPSRPNITPDLRMGLVSRTLPSCPSPWGPRTPKPNRESSVIDIESDSEDELASFNAGEGSMRWVLPIKDENVVCDGEGLGVV
ncbi:hypothetical protein FRC06_008409 [Ceratobasidium sp. 370]|nr:hypothetical protein FRC06_008409 [Ceratobasidium sp. 370]